MTNAKFLKDLGLLAVITSSLSGFAQPSEVSERFLSLSRELRVHRSEMLQRFEDEGDNSASKPGRGVRLYLRWAPPSGERLRSLSLSLESEGKQTGESFPVREERQWDLVWHTALLPRPAGDVAVLRIKADVESLRFRSPFQSVKEVQVFEGSLPIVMSTAKGIVSVVLELDADSPFSSSKDNSRALKLSRVISLEGADAR